jgi:hypothetical protein
MSQTNSSSSDEKARKGAEESDNAKELQKQAISEWMKLSDSLPGFRAQDVKCIESSRTYHGILHGGTSVTEPPEEAFSTSNHRYTVKAERMSARLTMLTDDNNPNSQDVSCIYYSPTTKTEYEVTPHVIIRYKRADSSIGGFTGSCQAGFNVTPTRIGGAGPTETPSDLYEKLDTQLRVYGSLLPSGNLQGCVPASRTFCSRMNREYNQTMGLGRSERETTADGSILSSLWSRLPWTMSRP